MFLPTYGYIKYELMPLESYKGIIVKKVDLNYISTRKELLISS